MTPSSRKEKILPGRSSGILLHPTSLPSRFGIGSLGHEAYRFVDFLADSGQSIWQILPLGPTGFGDSPYSAFSAFAGNPLLICLERLVEAGDLDYEDLSGVSLAEGEVNYGYAYAFKERLLRKGAERFRKGEDGERKGRFDIFCREQKDWLDDYALFRALRHHFQEKTWNRWPAETRKRAPEALAHWGEKLADSIYVQKYVQYVFFEQWFSLKNYANGKGVGIMGDIPIFVAYDSSDVWGHPHLFQLDDDGRSVFVSGVPPDYFSKTGQRWGNPLYRWERMEKEGFAWWLSRFRWNFTLFDLVRVDHFRGFEACWSIPAEEKTAVNGEWVSVPGKALFKRLGKVPIIAEDLGVITPEVEKLRDTFEFPGMKVLHFAFGSGTDNPYLPHNIPHHCVIYTGTHDNNTTLGWWKSLDEDMKREVRGYLGRESEDVVWGMIRLAMESVADLCIFPLQDLLGLDEKGRMNTPGDPKGNWRWRFPPGVLTEDLSGRLWEMTRTYGRGG